MLLLRNKCANLPFSPIANGWDFTGCTLTDISTLALPSSYGALPYPVRIDVTDAVQYLAAQTIAGCGSAKARMWVTRGTGINTQAATDVTFIIADFVHGTQNTVTVTTTSSWQLLELDMPLPLYESKLVGVYQGNGAIGSSTIGTSFYVLTERP